MPGWKTIEVSGLHDLPELNTHRTDRTGLTSSPSFDLALPSSSDLYPSLITSKDLVPLPFLLSQVLVLVLGTAFSAESRLELPDPCFTLLSCAR